MIVTDTGTGGSSSCASVVIAPLITIVLFGSSELLSTGVMVTVPVLSVAPAGIVKVMFSLRVTSGSSTLTSIVTASLVTLSRLAVTARDPEAFSAMTP